MSERGDGRNVTGGIATAHALAGGVAGGPRAGPYPMGLMAILATVAMLFAAFTAALLVRRTGGDWARVDLPPIVWLNTALLLASNAAVELARRAVRLGIQPLVASRLATGGVLGTLFLAGQVLAWRALAARGGFVPITPHATFVYTLSAVHGAHVLGGLAALGWTLRGALRGAYSPADHAGLSHAAIFWHFVGGVWIYLLVVLSTL